MDSQIMILTSESGIGPANVCSIVVPRQGMEAKGGRINKERGLPNFVYYHFFTQK